MAKPYQFTIRETVNKVLSRELTVEECVQSVLDRIESVDNKIHSFLTVESEPAIKRAREIDEKIRRGEKVGKLVGVAIAVKDNICTS